MFRSLLLWPVANIKSLHYGRGIKEMQNSEGCFDGAALLSIKQELPRWK